MLSSSAAHWAVICAVSLEEISESAYISVANDFLKQPVQNHQSLSRKMFSKIIFAAAESLSVIESVSMVTGVA